MEPKKIFFPALIWTFGIAIACLISTNSIPKVSILGKDKLVHAGFYFVFSLLWFSFLDKKQPHVHFLQKVRVVFLSALLYGLLIEVLQEVLTESRKADFYDVLANSAGSVLAISILYAKNKYNRNAR